MKVLLLIYLYFIVFVFGANTLYWCSLNTGTGQCAVGKNRNCGLTNSCKRGTLHDFSWADCQWRGGNGNEHGTSNTWVEFKTCCRNGGGGACYDNI